MGRRRNHAMREEMAMRVYQDALGRIYSSGQPLPTNVEAMLLALATDAWCAAEAFARAYDDHEKAVRRPAARVPVGALVTAFRQVAPELRQPDEELTTETRRRIATAFATVGEPVAWWEKFWKRCNRTPFLVGKNSYGFVASLLWTMEHVPEIQEGRYEGAVTEELSRNAKQRKRVEEIIQ